MVLDRRIEDNISSVGIVILHYVKDDLTNKCIQSIRDNTAEGTYYIYVIDNNSPEPFKLSGSTLDIRIIRNNCRYSTSGMNLGFYEALYNPDIGIEHDYIVNLDNDIEVHKDWLPPMVKEMDDNPKTGICGGKQWKPGTDSFYSVGADLMGWIYRDWPTERSNVFWIQGSFVMFRAKMMRMIGLHDTRYQDICSDSDYCIHAIDRGWDVVFVPDSSVTHIGGASYKDYPMESSQDFGQLIAKWFGTKFNSLANVLPINSQDDIYGVVTFKEQRR